MRQITLWVFRRETLLSKPLILHDELDTTSNGGEIKRYLQCASCATVLHGNTLWQHIQQRESFQVLWIHQTARYSLLQGSCPNGSCGSRNCSRVVNGKRKTSTESKMARCSAEANLCQLVVPNSSRCVHSLLRLARLKNSCYPLLTTGTPPQCRHKDPTLRTHPPIHFYKKFSWGWHTCRKMNSIDVTQLWRGERNRKDCGSNSWQMGT